MMSPSKKILFSARLAVLLIGVSPAVACAQFDLQLTLSNPQDFTPTQLAIMQEAMIDAERLWERVILGYQDGIDQTTLPVTIRGTTTGFGSANGRNSIVAGGFRIFTNGFMNINRNILEEFSNFRGEGTNIIDDLIAHEVGHVLGIGTLWVANDVYTFGSGEYRGEFGLAAYREEFDRDAEFVPVELAGAAGSANAHWDQIFRSSPQEGNPADPFSLDPRLGITDRMGRDLALELMTGALDPDFGDPFLSKLTVESLRDIGFRVRTIPEPATGVMTMLACIAGLSSRRRRCTMRRYG